MPPSSDFNPHSYDSILSTILANQETMKDQVAAIDVKIESGQREMGKRLGILETFKDGINGQHKLVISIAVFMGGVVPLIAFLWSLFPHK